MSRQQKQLLAKKSNDHKDQSSQRSADEEPNQRIQSIKVGVNRNLATTNFQTARTVKENKIQGKIELNKK